MNESEEHIWETPFREVGLSEPLNSFRLFTNFYVDVNPEPSSFELAKASGFKEGTIKKWRTKYKYRVRREAKRKYEQHEKRKAIKKSNEAITSLLAQLNKVRVQSHMEVSKDTLTRMKTLKELETLDAERIQLHKEESQQGRSYNELLNALKTSNEFDDYIKESATDTTVLNELIDQTQNIRYNENRDKIQSLTEELQDEEY